MLNYQRVWISKVCNTTPHQPTQWAILHIFLKNSCQKCRAQKKASGLWVLNRQSTLFIRSAEEKPCFDRVYTGSQCGPKLGGFGENLEQSMVIKQAGNTSNIIVPLLFGTPNTAVSFLGRSFSVRVPFEGLCQASKQSRV